MPPAVRPYINPFKALQKIHTAMLAGMVLFCVISAVVHIGGKLAANSNVNKILQVTVLAFSFILIKTAFTIFDRRIQALPMQATPAQKMKVYKTAAIIKWAMMELAVLLAVVSFMITRNYAFIVLAFGLIVFFAMQAPGKIKLMMQLQLSDQDAAGLEHASE